MRRPIKITPRPLPARADVPEGLDAPDAPAEHVAPDALDSGARVRFDDVEEQVSLISTALGNPSDLTVRRISDGIVCLFISPLAEQEAVRHSLVEPISKAGWCELQEKGQAARLLPVADVSEARSVEAAVDGVAEGKAALIVHGRPAPYMLDLRGRVVRQISPPISEPSVRGPRDSLTECLSDNLALVRQRIRSRNLRVRELIVGVETRTRVAVCDPPAVLDSSYLVSCLANRTWSLFPPAAATERADRVCAGILQGRVAVICDNSPFALVIPIGLSRYFRPTKTTTTCPYIHLCSGRFVPSAGWPLSWPRACT